MTLEEFNKQYDPNNRCIAFFSGIEGVILPVNATEGSVHIDNLFTTVQITTLDGVINTGEKL